MHSKGGCSDGALSKKKKKNEATDTDQEGNARILGSQALGFEDEVWAKDHEGADAAVSRSEWNLVQELFHHPGQRTPMALYRASNAGNTCYNRSHPWLHDTIRPLSSHGTAITGA
jgi:hypothetical protein